ncbi:MAG: gamma carbonic anhydrase family protein [Bacillota bacterium]|nr:gamma carbonic anhydrase family protein [Bacillota bacterium]
MIKCYQDDLKEINTKVYLAEGAKVIGFVKIDEFSSIWFNSVLRGDINRIEIGKYCNIQDGCVVHVADEHPTIVGDFVTVGHNAVLHGCTIEDHCLIGIGAIILNGAIVGKGSIISAGAVVKEGQQIPPHSLAAGVPAKVIKSLPDKIDSIHAQAVKYKTVWTECYGIDPDAEGERYQGEKII